MYRSLPSKRPRALEIHSRINKTGVGAYTEKILACTCTMHFHANYRIIINGGWALTRIEIGVYLGDYGT